MPKATPPAPVTHPAVGGDRAHVVRFELSPRNIVAFVLVVASLWLLIRLWPVLLVLVVALLVAGTLSPAVSWLEERRVKRGLGIAIVFTVFFVVALLVLDADDPDAGVAGRVARRAGARVRARLADISPAPT